MQIGGVIQQVDGQRFVCGITRFSQQFFASSLRFLAPAKPFWLSQFCAISIRWSVTIGGHVALRFHFINNDIAVHT